MCSLFQASVRTLGLAAHSGHLPARQSPLLNEVTGQAVGAVIYEEITRSNLIVGSFCALCILLVLSPSPLRLSAGSVRGAPLLTWGQGV